MNSAFRMFLPAMTRDGALGAALWISAYSGTMYSRRTGRSARRSHAPVRRLPRAARRPSRPRRGRARRSTGRPRTRSCRSRPAAPGRSRRARGDRSHSSEPTPMPTENTASSSEATCSSPPRFLGEVGNWLRNTVPKNQNHGCPAPSWNTTGCRARASGCASVSVTGFQLIRRSGRSAGGIARLTRLPVTASSAMRSPRRPARCRRGWRSRPPAACRAGSRRRCPSPPGRCRR